MGSDILENLPDNREKNGRWSDPDFQYKFFRALFRVGEDEQSVLHKVIRNVRKIWFERQHEPGPRVYFDRGRNIDGSPCTKYNFKFPEGWWLADKSNKPYRGEHFSHFYRLDWLQRRWSIALRFWTEKKPKPPEEIRKMYRLSDILSLFLRRYNIQTIDDFRRQDNAQESIFLLIDPATSPGLANLYDAHLEFVREATEQGLWHGASAMRCCPGCGKEIESTYKLKAVAEQLDFSSMGATISV